MNYTTAFCIYFVTGFAAVIAAEKAAYKPTIYNFMCLFSHSFVFLYCLTVETKK